MRNALVAFSLRPTASALFFIKCLFLTRDRHYFNPAGQTAFSREILEPPR